VKRLRAIVVDDEDLARRGLKLRLDRLQDIEVIAECRNGREATAAISALTPDLVFLDIEMPGQNGFDVVREIQSDAMPLIIFVTAFDQYAVSAFEVHAIDYLLKPVEEERLAAAVTRARTQLVAAEALTQKSRLMHLITDLSGRSRRAVEATLTETSSASAQDRLALKDGSEILRLAISTIDWIDAAGDYMCIHAEGRTHVIRTTMKELETQLDPKRFQRIHRSTLVNVDRVERLIPHSNGDYFVILSGGTQLKLSRTYRDKLPQFL